MASGGIIYEGGKLQLEVEDREDGTLVLRPIGTLNEDVNFGAVLEAISGLGLESGTYRFDLGQIVSINSCGIREWLLLLQRLQRTKTIEFECVAEVVIDQANIVPSVLGKGGSRVVSFFVPFFNEKTQERKMVLVATDEIIKNKRNLDAVKATLGPGEWEFDAIETEYFTFLKYVQP